MKINGMYVSSLAAAELLVLVGGGSLMIMIFAVAYMLDMCTRNLWR